MSAVLLLCRARLRSSWVPAAALVVLIGVGGGVTLSVAAGARRTASAFDVILAFTNARDLGADYAAEDPRRIEALVRPVEGVGAVGVVVGFLAFPADGGPHAEYDIIGFWNDPVEIGRPVVTAGRFPMGADEVLLNEAAAVALRLRPGDRFELALAEPSFMGFETVGLEVSGLGFDIGEVVEEERTAGRALWVSHAFAERHLDRALWGQAEIKVRPGSDAGALAATLAREGIFVDESIGEDRQLVQRSLRPLLTALAGMAALAAVATVVVAGQALSRIVRRRRDNDRSLRAVGITSFQLLGVDLLFAGAIGVAGAVAAVGAAVVASPLFPVGPTRRAGLRRGIDVDFMVLGLGGVALALALIGFVGFGSWRRRAGSRAISPGRVPSCSRPVLPPPPGSAWPPPSEGWRQRSRA